MVYRFKMTSGRKDGFYREYALYPDNTLYDFHRHIQDDLDFDEAQMAAFYTSDVKWNKHKQHALFDMGDGAMDSIVLENLIDEGITYLVYTFDFYNNRSLFIEFIGEEEQERRKSYPLTVDAKGTPPDQLVDRPVTEAALIENLLPKNDKKSVDDEDDFDDFDDDEEEEIDNDDELDDGDLDMLSETNEV